MTRREEPDAKVVITAPRENRGTPPRLISTRRLGRGVAATLSVGLAGAGTAEALLNNRHQYFPANSSAGAVSYRCVAPGAGSAKWAPVRTPSAISNAGHATSRCSPTGAGAGNACIATWGSSGGGWHQLDGYSCATGSQIARSYNGVQRGTQVQAVTSVDSTDPKHHWLEGVSRRSFVNY